MQKPFVGVIVLLAGAAVLATSCATGAGTGSAARSPVPQKVAKQRTVMVKTPVLVKESSFYPDGLPDEYVSYKYDEAKQKLLEKATFDATRPDPIERVVSEWKGGNLGADTVYESQGAVRLRKEYGYDASDRLVSDRVLDAKGVVQSSSSYTYDAAGNKTEWRAFDGAGLLKAVTRYSYGNGLLVFIDLRDPSEKSTGSIRLEYGEGGKLAKRTYFAADGSLQKYEAYIYDKGLLGAMETHRPDGSLSLKASYQYGDLGQLLSATSSDGSGAVRDVKKYEYVTRDEAKIETYFE